jgi:hypothetical protein
MTIVSKAVRLARCAPEDAANAITSAAVEWKVYRNEQVTTPRSLRLAKGSAR